MCLYFITGLKKDYEQKKKYFLTAGVEAAQKNLEVLRLVSLIISVLLFLFYAVIFVISKERPITLAHLLLLPAAIIFFTVSSKYLKSDDRSKQVITALCLLFELFTFAFVIYIDVFPYSNAQGVFLPLVYVAFSVCFIFPFWQTFSILFIVEIIYIILINLVKDPIAVTNDIFISILGLVLAFTANQIILKSRVEDYCVCTRYIHLSMTDSLTGILNKKSCEDAIQKYLELNTNHFCALLFLDLDDFKNINDCIGHDIGDQVLEGVGKLLFKSFRSTDIVGRIGGDEFMVLIKDFRDSEDSLKKKCDVLQYEICQAMLNLSVESSCSIGAVLFRNQSVDFQTIYKLADTSLYEAKLSGKNQCVMCGIPGGCTAKNLGSI